MRKVAALLAGLGVLMLVLRRKARRASVTIWFADGSVMTLQDREAAEIAEHAADIPAMARER